jgi:hypothetical protein
MNTECELLFKNGLPLFENTPKILIAGQRIQQLFDLLVI